MHFKVYQNIREMYNIGKGFVFELVKKIIFIRNKYFQSRNKKKKKHMNIT